MYFMPHFELDWFNNQMKNTDKVYEFSNYC